MPHRAIVTALGGLLTLSLAACMSSYGSGGGPTDPSGGGATTDPPGRSRDGTFQIRPVLSALQESDAGWEQAAVTCSGASASECVASHPEAGIVLSSPDESVRYVVGPPVVDGGGIQRATANRVGNAWEVDLQLSPEASQAFDTATSNAVGRKLAEIVDGVVVSAPTVEAPIRSGAIRVFGLSKQGAAALVAALGGSS
jgi:preprotein translocase subunit SecD